jgi:hypothetical protein
MKAAGLRRQPAGFDRKGAAFGGDQGASPIRAATGAASSVADMTSTSCRSGRSALRISHARPAQGRRSGCVREIRQRSHSPHAGKLGSDWIIRVRMPSVTTSIRVAARPWPRPGSGSPRSGPPLSPRFRPSARRRHRAARRGGVPASRCGPLSPDHAAFAIERVHRHMNMPFPASS